MRIEKRAKQLVIIAFLLMTIVGAVIGLDYTMSADENTEFHILRSNVTEYGCQLLGEDHPITQKLASRAKRISESIERDHGISMYYLFFPIGIVLNGISRSALMQGWHLYTFAIFMLGVAALYGIARELWHSRRVALLAALMLYLTPRMFAEGHYNNKDVVLMALFLMDMYFGIRWIRYDRLRDAILFAIVGAFAANTKILGCWCWGCLGLTYLCTRIARRELNAKAWRNGLLAVAIFAVGFWLLTPAMWTDPVGFFQYLLENATQFSRWKFGVLFEGQVYAVGNGQPLPWYYLPKLIAMTTPIYILVLSAIGTLVTARRLLRRGRGQEDALIAVVGIIGLVPMIYAMVSHMLLYNGWRHFSFFYATVMIFASCGLAWLWRVVRWKKALCGVMAALMGTMGVQIVLNHPLEGSYYNAVAAPFVDGEYETDYWYLSLGATLERLAEYSDKTAAKVAFNAATSFAGDCVLNMSSEYSERFEYVPTAADADYVIQIGMYAQVEEGLPDDFLENYISVSKFRDEVKMLRWKCTDEFQKAFDVEAWGIPVVTVYERVSGGN